MASLFHAVKYALPDTGATSFAIPLFGEHDEGETFVQSIGQNNIIEDFVRFKDVNFFAVFSEERFTKQVGECALFCFNFSGGDVVVGSQEYVCNILRDRFEDLSQCWGRGC